MLAWLTGGYTVVQILNGILTFVKGLFGKSTTDTTQDAATQAVKLTNEIGHVTAEVSRDTSATVNQKLSDAIAQTAAGVALVDSASSVRDQDTAVADAITRANQDPSSNG